MVQGGEAFSKADVDGSGFLDAAEFGFALRLLGRHTHDPQQTLQLFNDLTGETGGVTLVDFVNFIQEMG